MENKKHNITASAEDYLETVFILSAENPENPVRVTDIARSLGVSKPSVTHAVAQLREKGLLRHEAYACRMEHILSAETMEKMYEYLEKQSVEGVREP